MDNFEKRMYIIDKFNVKITFFLNSCAFLKELLYIGSNLSHFFNLFFSLLKCFYALCDLATIRLTNPLKTHLGCFIHSAKRNFILTTC
jgi:hypothetical protein